MGESEDQMKRVRNRALRLFAKAGALAGGVGAPASMIFSNFLLGLAHSLLQRKALDRRER